ncbi:MAG: methyltransferase domain-containing protein [Alphaproteobacteria bacterium]
MNAQHNDVLIFDRKRLLQARKRSAPALADYDFLIRKAQNEIIDRLGDIKRDFPFAAYLGREGAQPFLLDAPSKIGNLIKAFPPESASASSQPDIFTGEDYLPFADESLDLVLSTLSLHSINDLPGTLIQINRALKPDGLFLAAMFGGETLWELRESLMQAELTLKNGASPRVFPFADKQQAGALLQRTGFALPVVDSDILTVTYDDMFKLMHDIRGMGEGNIIAARSRTNPGKAFFMEAARYYAERFSDPDGRIRASFEIIYMIGWAPHESQQKPLRPGGKTGWPALQTEETAL